MTPGFTSEIRRQSPSLGPLLDEFEKARDDYEVRFRAAFFRRPGGRMILRDAARLNLLSAHARARVLAGAWYWPLTRSSRLACEWLSEMCHPNLQARLGDHAFDGPEFVFLGSLYSRRVISTWCSSIRALVILSFPLPSRAVSSSLAGGHDGMIAAIYARKCTDQKGA
jgi:hypothetical protein